MVIFTVSKLQSGPVDCTQNLLNAEPNVEAINLGLEKSLFLICNL